MVRLIQVTSAEQIQFPHRIKFMNFKLAIPTTMTYHRVIEGQGLELTWKTAICKLFFFCLIIQKGFPSRECIVHQCTYKTKVDAF